jgi:Arc/MetJ family transcription regulator
MGAVMRTTIDIDDKPMEAALRESGLKSKRAVVEEGLRLLIRQRRYQRLRAAFGKYPWDGELSEQRRSWESG